jgi:signal transduction histidine kinase
LNDREISEVVSMLAHDLRTPLACLKGYLSLLGEGKYAPDSPEWKEFFALCVDECDHIEDLIESLLESAVRDTEIVLHCEPVFLPTLVKRIIAEVSVQNPNRRFAVDVHPDCNTVWADPLRLEQILGNLVENAAKYSAEGTLVVVKVRKDKGTVQFSVSDQGHGIAREHLNRLFDRFYRVPDPRASDVRGTGLGLPIARAIVEAHGGEIWAESVLGRGSTFRFTLPAHEGGSQDTVRGGAGK